MNENTPKTDSGIPVKQFFVKDDLKNGRKADRFVYGK